MLRKVLTLSAAAMVAASLAPAANVASAAPLSGALALDHAALPAFDQVQWRRGGFGWGLGAGLLGGAIIGGALAARPYYPPAYYDGPYGPYEYGPPPGAYGPGPGYGPGPAPGPDAVAYCARKYRSYDPSTGTYVANGGARRPCP